MMATCPSCSDIMTRHLYHGKIYWFCRNCWQRLPEPYMEQVNLCLGLKPEATSFRLEPLPASKRGAQTLPGQLKQFSAAIERTTKSA